MTAEEQIPAGSTHVGQTSRLTLETALREEPPSAASTASGGSPSSAPGGRDGQAAAPGPRLTVPSRPPSALGDGSGIIARKPGRGATSVLPGLPSPSALSDPFWPHWPAAGEGSNGSLSASANAAAAAAATAAAGALNTPPTQETT